MLSETPSRGGRVRISEHNRQIVELTQLEVQHLYDRIGGGDLSDGEEVFPAVSAAELRTLMLQLASALVEVAPPHGAEVVSMSFTENDIWMMKDRVALTDCIGTINIGLSLSTKLCEALLKICDWPE